MCCNSNHVFPAGAESAVIARGIRSSLDTFPRSEGGFVVLVIADHRQYLLAKEDLDRQFMPFVNLRKITNEEVLV